MVRHYHDNDSLVSLGDLEVGAKATIRGISDPQSGEISDLLDEDALRLAELGFVPEVLVEIVHEAPLGGSPIAVRVRGALIGIRRENARRVIVTKNGAT